MKEFFNKHKIQIIVGFLAVAVLGSGTIYIFSNINNQDDPISTQSSGDILNPTTVEPVKTSAPVETPSIVETPEPSGIADAIEMPEPAETPDSIDMPSPAETPDAVEMPNPIEAPDVVKPTPTPKVVEPTPMPTPKPTPTPTETPIPTPSVTPAPPATIPPTDNPKAKEPEMLEAKSYIDIIGKYAELFKPYASQALAQDDKIQEVEDRLAKRMMEIRTKYGYDDVVALENEERILYGKMISEITDKRNILRNIYNSQKAHQDCIKQYEQYLNSPNEEYPRSSLNWLKILSSNYEETYENINQRLDDLSDTKIKEYENRGFELIKQIEEVVKQNIKP